MDRARRSPRHIVDARVEGHASFWSEVRVVDLSPSGALLETTRFLEPGSSVTVELDVDDDPMVLSARIVHCSFTREGPHRVGVRFLELARPDSDRIRGFIHRRLEEERREQPRIFVDRQAQLKKEIELTVLNLSLFGGLFSASFPLEFGTVQGFRFELPQGEVHVRGVVRHCEAWAEAKGAAIFRLGVEFTELSGADRDRVVEYLESNQAGH